MLIGAIAARYLKAFTIANPLWFYIHSICQAAASVVGVAGFVTGIKLGSDSTGVTHTSHRNMGITLFILGILQVHSIFSFIHLLTINKKPTSIVHLLH